MSSAMGISRNLVKVYRVAIYSSFLLIGDERGNFPNKKLSFSLREVNRKTKSLVLIFLLQNVSCYYIVSRLLRNKRRECSAKVCLSAFHLVSLQKWKSLRIVSKFFLCSYHWIELCIAQMCLFSWLKTAFTFVDYEAKWFLVL